MTGTNVQEGCDMRKRMANDERGAALLETAITLPIILLICVGIFEFGRAYQTWQVLTNASREGARASVISGTTPAMVKAAVIAYAKIGGIPQCPAAKGVTCIDAAYINVDQNITIDGRQYSRIEIQQPFNFIVINGIAKMIKGSSKTGAPLTMIARSVMRNEGA
jgi:Flp pilus assembly protein TadG